MEGEGVFLFSDGRTYTGQWKQNNMHGVGELRFLNGDKYIGKFYNGVYDGMMEFYNSKT